MTLFAVGILGITARSSYMLAELFPDMPSFEVEGGGVGATEIVQTTLDHFGEPTIADKTHSEILSMPRWKRCCWYMTISSERKEEAMKIVETIRRANNRASWTPERRAKHSKRMADRIISEETRAKISAAKIGKNNPMYGRAGENSPTFGKIFSEKHRAKISAAKMGKTASEETKAKLSAGRMGEKNHFFGKHHSEMSKAKMSTAHMGKILTKEHKAKLGAAQTGEKNWNWKGGVSFEPYCPAFNDQLKESIRNRDNRTCVLCGKGEIQNGQRLCVHHIDADKMQGCNGKRWYLCALCRSCNIRLDTVEKEFLIVTRGGGFG